MRKLKDNIYVVIIKEHIFYCFLSKKAIKKFLFDTDYILISFKKFKKLCKGDLIKNDFNLPSQRS
jgi:hypothetical protein